MEYFPPPCVLCFSVLQYSEVGNVLAITCTLERGGANDVKQLETMVKRTALTCINTLKVAVARQHI